MGFLFCGQSVEMIRIFGLILLLFGLSSSLKYVERRTVQASSGDYFSCFYTLQYNANGVVSTKKSSVICQPDVNGGNAIEVFDLPGAGPTSIKHNIKEGKESVKKASAFTGTTSTSMVMPMNCSCKTDFPHELMEMMNPQEMLATGRGRGGGGVGFLLAPLLLVLLLPTFITSVQGLLAGRSLSVDTLTEELTDRLADRLNAGEFELADVDRLMEKPESQRTFLISLILNQIRTQIQARIQALISSLTGGVVAGRKFEMSTLKSRMQERGRTSFSSSIFSQLQAQIVAAIQTAITNFLNSLGLVPAGRGLNTVPLQERQLLIQTALQNCLAQIQAAIQNFLNAFGLGRTGLSSSIFSTIQAQILAAIQTAITNFLNSLGLGVVVGGRGLNMEASDRQLFSNLLGAINAEPQTTTTSPPTPADVEDFMSLVDQVITEITGLSGGMEQMIQMMEQMEQMSDEEVVQQVMEMMGGMEGMTEMFGDMNMNGQDVMSMFVAEFEKPANCNCQPSEQEHGLLMG